MTSRPRPPVVATDDTPPAASAGGAVQPGAPGLPGIPGGSVGLATLLLLAAVLVTLAGYGAVQRLSATFDATEQQAEEPQAPAWALAQPAMRSDFPDPALLVVGGIYYAYATNAYGKHIQVARSSDLRHWEPLPDALPTLPAWAAPSGAWVWAPAVMQINGRFVLYYVARVAAAQRQCIGVATSATPQGPFTPANAQPLVCQLSLGGDIDPAPFEDGQNGQDGAALYLYFKSDGNCCQQATRLWGQRLTPDGLSLMGAPVALLKNDQPWEGDVIEAPDMLAHAGVYDLFYSGNDYGTARYAVGYARCQTPLGPCAKTPDSPILASPPGVRAPLAGPGGEALFQAADGATLIAFHAWDVASGGALGPSRYLLIARLGWHGATPIVLPGTPGT